MKKFNSNEEFMNHIFTCIDEKMLTFFETYSDGAVEYDEGEDCNVYFLNNDFSLTSLATTLLSLYGDNLILKISHEIEVPIEDEDGDKFYQKKLEATLWPDDYHPLDW